VYFIQLGLAGNPLECVCGLHWLFKRLQPYNDTFWYPAIRWRCADVQMMFNQLVDADFDGCSGAAVFTAAECEDLIPTTTPVPIYPDDRRLELTATATTSRSVTVKWKVAAGVDLVDQVTTMQWHVTSERTKINLNYIS